MIVANSKNYQRKIRNLSSYYTAIFAAILVYIRIISGESFLSYDYTSYIIIIEKIGTLPIDDMLKGSFHFPYVKYPGIIDVEIGFAIIVKALTSLGLDAQAAYAAIAATSVGLRVYVMRAIGVPIYWVVALNIIAITLFEANALRLGFAIGFLFLGLRQLSESRNIFGWIAVFTSAMMHIQVIIYAIPFAIYYFFIPWTDISRTRLILVVVVFVGISTIFRPVFQMVSNEKLRIYMDLGGSSSTGVSLTSSLAAILLALTVLCFKFRTPENIDAAFFSGILAACVPSVTMLIVLTDVAVVGDRAWQVAFMVFSTFFFTNWVPDSAKKVPLAVLLLLSLVVGANVMIRFPLSDFFSPPFPEGRGKNGPR